MSPSVPELIALVAPLAVATALLLLAGCLRLRHRREQRRAARWNAAVGPLVDAVTDAPGSPIAPAAIELLRRDPRRGLRWLTDALYPLRGAVDRRAVELLREADLLRRVILRANGRDPADRLAAVALLAQLDAAEIDHVLLHHLDDADPAVASQAAAGLLRRIDRMPKVDATRCLIALGAADPLRLIELTGELRAAGAETLLALAAEDPTATAAGCGIAARWPDLAPAPLLSAGLDHGDLRVRLWACRAASAAAHGEALAVRLAALLADDPYPVVRAAAADALAAARLPRLAPAFAAALADPEPWVADRACAALRALGEAAEPTVRGLRDAGGIGADWADEIAGPRPAGDAA